VTRVLDCHVHIFPTAEEGIFWQEAVGLTAPRSGVLADFVAYMDASGLSGAVVLLFHRSAQTLEALVGEGVPVQDARAEVVRRIRAYNRWGCEAAEDDPRLLPFVGVNPSMMSGPEMRSEIEELATRGARGVKIIPPAIGLPVNADDYEPIYEACCSLGLPLLSQSGAGATPDAPAHGRPRLFADVLDRHGELKLILAHMARGFERELHELLDSYPNVVTDTSSRLEHLNEDGQWTRNEMRDFVRGLGAERVLYGTNFPLADPARSLAVLESLGLTPREFAQITSENLERVLAR
jgi:hypothetical protein